jgi:hypothetical protein
VPTGLRPSADSPWAPEAGGDDFVISELLVDQPPAADDAPGAEGTRVGEPDDPVGQVPPAAGGRRPEDQARIAADQARRRRSRRGGRGRSGG